MAEVKEKRPSVKAEERHAESFISGISHRSRFNVNETLLTDFSFSTFNIRSSVETQQFLDDTIPVPIKNYRPKVTLFFNKPLNWCNKMIIKSKRRTRSTHQCSITGALKKNTQRQLVRIALILQIRLHK